MELPLTLKGLEFDFTWAASENTTVQGGVGYTDAKIASFPAGADCGDYDDVFGNSNCVGQSADVIQNGKVLWL